MAHGTLCGEPQATERAAANCVAHALAVPLKALLLQSDAIVRKKSAAKGVSWHCRRQGWVAQVQQKTLGIFAREEDAAAAVSAAQGKGQKRKRSPKEPTAKSTVSRYQNVSWHRGKRGFVVPHLPGGVFATDREAAEHLAAMTGRGLEDIPPPRRPSKAAAVRFVRILVNGVYDGVHIPGDLASAIRRRQQSGPGSRHGDRPSIRGLSLLAKYDPWCQALCRAAARCRKLDLLPPPHTLPSANLSLLPMKSRDSALVGAYGTEAVALHEIITAALTDMQGKQQELASWSANVGRQVGHHTSLVPHLTAMGITATTTGQRGIAIGQGGKRVVVLPCSGEVLHQLCRLVHMCQLISDLPVPRKAEEWLEAMQTMDKGADPLPKGFTRGGYHLMWLVRSWFVVEMRAAGIARLAVPAGYLAVQLGALTPDQCGWLRYLVAGRGDTAHDFMARLGYKGPPELLTMWLCLALSLANVASFEWVEQNQRALRAAVRTHISTHGLPPHPLTLLTLLGQGNNQD